MKLKHLVMVRTSIIKLKTISLINKVWHKPNHLNKKKELDKGLDFFLQKIFQLTPSEYYIKIIENKKINLTFKILIQLIFGTFLKKLNYPFEYIVNEKNFLRENFFINKKVFIPRSETEQLVELIKNENQSLNQQDKLNYKALDIGTGSGVIAISLKKAFPKMKVVGIDADKKAIKIAKMNANTILGFEKKISLYHKDIFSKETKSFIKAIQFDLIVSNPPYIGESEIALMSSSTLKHEPKMALFAGREGLDFYQKLSPLLIDWLSRKGKVYLEMGFNQAKEVEKIFSWLDNKRIIKDLSGKDRFFYGESPLK